MNKSKAEELWKNSRDGLFDFAVEIAEQNRVVILRVQKSRPVVAGDPETKRRNR
jgi:hypothetical protein